MIPPPPRSTLFPYTTLFRSLVEGARVIPAGEWIGWAPTWMLGRRIRGKRLGIVGMGRIGQALAHRAKRSEEHTSELQSHSDLVCRLLLEKKKKKKKYNIRRT